MLTQHTLKINLCATARHFQARNKPTDLHLAGIQYFILTLFSMARPPCMDETGN